MRDPIRFRTFTVDCFFGALWRIVFVVEPRSLGKNDAKLRVLQVINGFPPYAMAGVEVYTYNLCKALSALPDVDVSVFSRADDLYSPFYSVRREDYYGIRVYSIAKPCRDHLFEDKFLDPLVDCVFRQLLVDIRP
ncbi:MAG: hypothetical protein RBG13Loki_2435 [Promethearchaeota archaeon CR_4]|nr:MAG: hypothetical protein RBG13Loki_2435 [Candidatus Lokiarchaeota archaeon CR_4]